MFDIITGLITLIVLLCVGYSFIKALQWIERKGKRLIDQARNISTDERELKDLEKEKERLLKAERIKAVTDQIINQRKEIERDIKHTRTSSILEVWMGLIGLIFMVYILMKLVGHFEESDKHMDALLKQSEAYSERLRTR